MPAFLVNGIKSVLLKEVVQCVVLLTFISKIIRSDAVAVVECV